MPKAKPAPPVFTNPYQKYLEGKDPLRVLPTTPKQLAKLVEGLTPRQLKTRVEKDKWSIHEIVGHLADTEMMFGARFRWILFEDSPTLVGFDQDAWARGWLREKETTAEALARFTTLRQSLARLLKHTPDADFDRSGVHTERGKVTAREYLPLVAGHDLNHLAQIAALRTALLKK